MPDDIIASQQLAGLQAGINTVFGNINSQPSSTGLSTQLPLLGSGSAPITVAQLQALQAQIYSGQSTLASTGTSFLLSQIEGTVNGALTTAGFTANAQVSLDANSDVLIDLNHASKTFSSSVSLQDNLPLSGAPLHIGQNRWAADEFFEILDCLCQTLAQGNRWRPSEKCASFFNIGASLSRIINGQRHKYDL